MRNARALRHGLEALAAQLFEMLAGSAHAAAHRRAVVRAGGQQRDFEGAAVMAFEQLHQQLAGGVLMEVGRQVADAQPGGGGGWLAFGLDFGQALGHDGGRAARQHPHAARRVQRVVACHFQQLQRVADEHGMRERAGLHRHAIGQRLHRLTQAGQRLVGRPPAAGFAFHEGELAARRQLAAADAEQHGAAHALGGFGLHAEVLERHAELEVRHAVVHLQHQRIEEGAHRFLVAMAALQRVRERHMVGMVAGHLNGQGAQATHGVFGAPEAEQRMRFEQAGGRRTGIGAADAARPLHRLLAAAGLDQRMRGRQRIGGVVMQGGGLLEGMGRQRPLFRLRMLTARLPALVGTGVGTRMRQRAVARACIRMICRGRRSSGAGGVGKG